ncbi:probable ubiquitin-like-specific protease 2A isoform X2 [Lactuca sativa]|uniref:probable ubiquitin-like-specific protease 2A isoform X2 n=1 Tax=Lactuca sativa TaxID=4236 RepID=UPI000CD9E033|nr:probable ubiquitin-like-specific protease 2A isoform X2 [Lactuca sativa]
MHPSPETSKKRAIEELSDSQDDHHPTTITRQRRGNRGNMVNQAKKLNSDKVHSYLDDSNKEKVLNWIKKKDIFSRKYVVFPIVQWGHWSVLIFCHFGESLGSKFKTPCILLLDSLAKADHSKQLEPVIRKNLERTEDKKLLRKMPFLVPKVPQQRDNQECGFFALYYIKLFVESAPESFSISNGYPYFMKKDWFSSEGLGGFCKTLDFSHK